jgi:hypothetical protein
MWMQFSDFRQRPPLRRRLGLMGEETLRALQYSHDSGQQRREKNVNPSLPR